MFPVWDRAITAGRDRTVTAGSSLLCAAAAVRDVPHRQLRHQSVPVAAPGRLNREL